MSFLSKATRTFNASTTSQLELKLTFWLAIGSASRREEFGNARGRKDYYLGFVEGSINSWSRFGGWNGCSLVIRRLGFGLYSPLQSGCIPRLERDTDQVDEWHVGILGNRRLGFAATPGRDADSQGGGCNNLKTRVQQIVQCTRLNKELRTAVPYSGG